jgi:hypothetical protein
MIRDSTSKNMKVSVLIVNYKTPQLVLDCISFIHEFDVDRIEIIVIDNDSNDGVEERLKIHYPKVQFLQMGYNAGFARANNAGIRIASGDAVLLLNSDTIVLDNAINRCANNFFKSSFVACGVQLLNKDLSVQISGNYATKGGLNYLLPLPYLGGILKTIGTIMGIEKPHLPSASSTHEVDWVNGAFLMVKKTVIEQAGMMDEEFFLYAEEAEWCSRLKKVGPIAIFGDCKVIHLQGASATDAFDASTKGYANLSDKMGFQIMLSNLVRIRKEFGLAWFVLIFSAYIIEIPFYFICMLLDSLINGNAPKKFADWKGYTKNIFGCFSFIDSIVFEKEKFYKVL